MSDKVTVRIEKLVHGGEGLAHLENGKAVFVRGVLPEELVQAVITGKRKGVYQADATEVLERSPDRIIPPCGDALQCTGATWPFIAYPAQLRLKTDILLDALQRTGGITPHRPLPILPSPRLDHYRLRSQFTVRMREGKHRFGFFRQGSTDLVEVDDAYLLAPVINRALKALRKLASLLPPLAEVHINAAPSGEAHLLLFCEDPGFPPQQRFLADLQRELPDVVGITGFAGKRKAWSLGRDFLTLEAAGLAFQATEGNFFQVNWEQNRNMIGTVLDLAGLSGAETVLDLYCGIGNFALPLARMAAQVIGIESGYSAIDDARRNAGRNGIKNVEFIADDLQRGLKPLLERKLRAGVIVLDPPRAGATLKTLERILAFVPRKIVYVSCNPATLARDLKFFHLFGFRLDRLQPVDMFPWTYHIEAVAEMVRQE
jgi:23S rRNA (uracil1939-C5)-methyltransferase